MPKASPTSDYTHVNHSSGADSDINGHDNDSSMNGGSSLQQTQSRGDNHSLPDFTWNVGTSRPSVEFNNFLPKLTRRRKLGMSLASALQEDYRSLLEHSTPAATQMLESEIYTCLMLKRKYGYPLYRPEPLKDLPAEYGGKGVRIGDVGRITPDGAFDFLFNVDSAQASAINPSTLPRDFETVPPMKIKSEDYFRKGAQIFSDHVGQINNKTIAYNCLASEGAVLHLPENTVLLGAEDKDELYELVARHAHNWYEYLVINRPPEVANGSLYLVTGCIKTSNWGIGVFNNHSAETDYLEFVCEDQGPRRRYGWRTVGPIVAKVTPTSVNISNTNVGEPNQCVFLLGFKIALRQSLWKSLQYRAPNQSSTAEAHPQGSSSYSYYSRYSINTISSVQGTTLLSHSPTHSEAKVNSDVQDTIARLEGQSSAPKSRSVLLQQIFNSTCLVHPSDFINAMLLLNEPDADVSIVHDDEWCDLLPNNFAVDPRQLEIKNFLETVAKSRISELNQYACVSLKKPAQSSTDDVQDYVHARASSDLLPLRQDEIDRMNAVTTRQRRRSSSQDVANNGPLIPTTTATAEQCPRFRILLVGRSGVGKSSLINSIFKTSLAVEDHQAGYASIEREIISPYNEHLVIHDSEGYEPGDPHKFEVIKKFITRRCNEPSFSEKLHAVWLCITTPYGNGRVLETGDEEICGLKELGVPVIIVFTKYDLLLSVAKRELLTKGSGGTGDDLLNKTQDLAKKKFEAQCIPPLMQLATKVPGKIPYICVTTRYDGTLDKLVQITLKNISIPKQPQRTKPLLKRLREGISKKRAGIPDNDHNVSPTEDYSDPRTLTLAIAQRVDIKSKLAASISVGKRKYWSGLASGFHFRNNSIWRCLQVIHTDIVNVWNIRGMSQYLLGDPFRHAMTIIVGDLSPDVPGQNWTNTSLAGHLAHAGNTVVSAGPAAVVIAPIAATVALAAWVYEIYKQAPHIIRCFMGYIVDLTIIVQTLFKIAAQHNEGTVEEVRVGEILDNFMRSQIKETVHAEIRAFVSGLKSRFERDAIIQKIDSLIYSNRDVEL